MLLLLGCSDEEAKIKFTNVFILVDVTDQVFRDQNVVVENVPRLLKMMNIDTMTAGMSGGEVKLFTINDLSETKSSTVKLAQGVAGLLGQNPLDRQDEIKKFRRELLSSIESTLKGVEWQKDKSKIYQNICRELNSLARIDDKHKKVMIVFSDMLENSELLSFYKTDTDALISQIDEFEKNTLSIDCSLPSLDKVEFYIVSNRNKGNDEKINKAERFWKALFNSKNVKHFAFDAELHLEE